MSEEQYRAPLKNIIPSFIPVILEKGVPGYEGAELVSGEKRLSHSELHSLLIACLYLGAYEHVLNKGFDDDRVRQIFSKSLFESENLSPEEKRQALSLVDRFFNYKIIRENHPFDDWVCEALWGQFQDIPYEYPTGMSTAVSYALTVRHTLNKCTIED